MPKSELEEILANQIAFAGLPEPEREYRFAAMLIGLGPGLRLRFAVTNLKDWRFDFAWPAQMLAVEIEGGIWLRSKGRHTGGVGFTEDCTKYNEAMLMGWRVLRVVGEWVRSGEALALIERALR